MRRAIEAIPSRYSTGLLERFPHYCCKPASQLLARYLVTVARVPMIKFVSARRHGGPYCRSGWQSHVWLEAGGLIVDITADQYREVPSGVIVESASEWHDTFQIQSRVSYGEMMRMERSYSRRFNRTFNKLLTAMKEPLTTRRGEGRSDAKRGPAVAQLGVVGAKVSLETRKCASLKQGLAAASSRRPAKAGAAGLGRAALLLPASAIGLAAAMLREIGLHGD